jgi:peptidyl-tRNA hydrolase
MDDKLPKIRKVKTSLPEENPKLEAEQAEASILQSIQELRETVVGGIGSLVELSASELSPDKKIALAEALKELTKVISTAMKQPVALIEPKREDVLEIPSGEHRVIGKGPEDKTGVVKVRGSVRRIAG